MDLSTIDMDQSKALEYANEYREAFRAKHQEIDGELMRGFAEIAKGRQLLRLGETIRSAGVDDQGRPRLAIARADEPKVTFERRQTHVTFRPPWENGHNISSPDRVLTVVDMPSIGTTQIWMNHWEAISPIIPPRFRPPYKLENYHLLWEAAWTRPQRRRAPGDPALLRRIGGDLFVVLAVWDLTPLEQAILEMRPS